MRSARLTPIRARARPPYEARRDASSQSARTSKYRVALFRGGAQVFEQDVTVPALALSQSWTYQGRFLRLQRGAYRWIVWPLFGKGTATRTGPPIVSAQYVV